MAANRPGARMSRKEFERLKAFDQAKKMAKQFAPRIGRKSPKTVNNHWTIPGGLSETNRRKH